MSAALPPLRRREQEALREDAAKRVDTLEADCLANSSHREMGTLEQATGTLQAPLHEICLWRAAHKTMETAPQVRGANREALAELSRGEGGTVLDGPERRDQPLGCARHSQRTVFLGLGDA